MRSFAQMEVHCVSWRCPELVQQLLRNPAVLFVHGPCDT